MEAVINDNMFSSDYSDLSAGTFCIPPTCSDFGRIVLKIGTTSPKCFSHWADLIKE